MPSGMSGRSGIVVVTMERLFPLIESHVDPEGLNGGPNRCKRKLKTKFQFQTLQETPRPWQKTANIPFQFFL